MNFTSSKSPNSSTYFPLFETDRPSPRSVAFFRCSESNVVYQQPTLPCDVSKTDLLSLCKEGKWDEAKVRCSVHPSEARPIVHYSNKSDELLYMPPCKRIAAHAEPISLTPTGVRSWDQFYRFDTALALACKSSSQPDGAPLDVIQAIYAACPDQLSFGMSTPLHEAISAGAELDTLKFLIDAASKTTAASDRNNLLSEFEMEVSTRKRKQSCSQESACSNYNIALLLRDENDMTPLDHLISAAILGTPSHAVDALEYLLNCCPRAAYGYHQKNPLLHLLGTTTIGVDEARHGRIVTATKLLLSVCPELVGIPSSSSGFTPIHLAIMYYGSSVDMIQMLIRANPQSVGAKSLGGDLPIHTAMAAGVPMETLEVILSATASLSTDLLSATDSRGLSPIQLAWIKHLDPDFDHRLPKIRKLPIYGTLLDEAVKDTSQLLSRVEQKSHENVRNCIISMFGTFWERTELFLRYVRIADDWKLVHAASAVNVPRAVLSLALMLHPEQVKETDSSGRLPLHIAASAPKYPWWTQHGSTRDSEFSAIEMLLQLNPQAATCPDKDIQLPLQLAIERERKDKTLPSESDVKRIVEAYPEALGVQDPKSRLYPFMQAAADGNSASIETIYFLLRESPHLVSGGVSSM